ncbi:MAG: hypothetical protein AAF291_00590 [Pseudomonadota bacterium]
MAQIPVEKKSSIWPWILLALAIVAALLLFLMLPDEADDTPAIAADTADQTSIADADAEMTLATILANPQAYIGRDNFTGKVDVPAVPTDRGFWVEHEGSQMFALLIDGPQEVPLDINPGQNLQVNGGTVRDAGDLENLPGEPIDDDTRAILAEQDVFLLIDEDQIEILAR